MSRLLIASLVVCSWMLTANCQSPLVVYERVSARELGIDPDQPITYEEPTRPLFQRMVNYTPYLPDTLHPRYQPARIVQLAFHYMNTQDTFYQEYEGDAGLEYAKSLVYYMNTNLARNEAYRLNPALTVYPPGWRFEIGKDPASKEAAVYHHYTDDDYHYLHAGPHQNRGSRSVLQYAVTTDSLLNIFIMAPPRDSMLSPTFKPEDPLGVWMGSVIKVTGFHPRRQPWSHKNNLNHEANHAFGLPHAWLRNDGCDDTVAHPNDCWNENSGPGCDTMVSNNVMDYNVWQIALTPCQIGRVREAFAREGSRPRGWLKTGWCRYRPDQTIQIKEEINWEGARDLESDLFIKAGARLYVNERLHLPIGARIVIEPGGVLHLGPKAWIHNDCGENWGGIEIGRAGRSQGILITDEGFRVDNLSEV
ncbi:MAG: hypothetical protein AAF433_00240 [Bacteroidota bacterium]